MRLNPKWQRDVTIYPVKREKDSMGAVATVPGVPSPATLHVQPGGGSVLLQEYGLRAVHMLSCFAFPGTEIKPGDFVRVYSIDKPDYRVVSVQDWPSYRPVHLEEADLYAGT